MNEVQWAYLDGYLRNLADRMGLRDWRVDLQRTPVPTDEPDTHARTWMANRTQLTRIEVCRDFAEKPANEQREILVHELIHPHCYRADRVFYRLEGQITPALWKVAEDAYMEEQDIGIDALARIIAPLMPPCELPPDEVAPTKASKARWLAGLLHTRTDRVPVGFLAPAE